jgi:PAS domain S-box-containing protein
LTLLFNVPQAPFFSIFSLAVVLSAIFGGIKPGLVSMGCSTLFNLASIYPPFSPDRPDHTDIARLITFVVTGGIIAILIGAAGELQHRLDIERRKLSVTLRSIGDAVIATDAHARVSFMNAAAEQATGYTQQESVGRHITEIFRIVNEETRATVENPVEKVLATGQTVGLANHTVLVRKDGGEVPVDDSAAPIVAEGVLTGTVLVFRDITANRVKEAALVRAEKLASVGRLAATIAHEINNPLECVTNLLYLIATCDNISNVRPLAEAAQNELARAAHVTRQTLSFARTTGTRESADLAALVDGIVNLYTDKLNSKNVQLIKNYRGDGVAIASRSEVRQVISNLLANAIDAERQGGRIDIRVHPSLGGGSVSLVVADRGCGMSPEQMRRIFEPFFTTKQDVGTGLGLWVTKRIVDSHGGAIRVRSNVGRGTVFLVNWPMHETTPLSEAVSAPD